MIVSQFSKDSMYLIVFDIPIFYSHNLGIHHTRFQGHGYFFSWEHPITKNLTVNWLTGRNICRRHCMDLVSLGMKILHL